MNDVCGLSLIFISSLLSLNFLVLANPRFLKLEFGLS